MLNSTYHYLQQFYKSYQRKLAVWDLNGKASVNHLAMMMLVISSGFSILLFITGAQNWYFTLFALSIYLLIIWMNKKQRSNMATQLLLVGSLMLISFWSFTNRKVSAELGYLSLVCTLPMLVRSILSTLLWFIICVVCILLYCFYDATTEVNLATSDLANFVNDHQISIQ